MPFVTIAIFLFFMYIGSSPGIFVGSIIITYYFVFVLMVWIGGSVSSSESPVMEQIIILRTQNNVFYYISKTIFVIILGLVVNSICLFLPVGMNLLNGGGVFKGAVTISDVINAFILLCGASVAGGSMGSFFHTRVMKDRKLAILLTVLGLICTLARTAITNGAPVTKKIIWILPPLDSVSRVYSKASNFETVKSLGIFSVLFLYSIIFFTVKSLICQKRKF